MPQKLSILIITYNRPEDTLALLKNLKQQNNLCSYVGEILLLNNASSEPYSVVNDFIEKNPEIPIKFINHDKNLGVAGGRNYLIQKAEYPYLLFLDDDVIFEKSNAISRVSSLFLKKRNSTNQVGVITLNIFYHSTKTQQINAFPHKKYKVYKDKEWFLTYYFSGGALLIKKEIFEKVGYYPSDFFYGMEEYDLSYRIIEAGYKIAYEGSVKVFHKETQKGRITDYHKSAMMWYNKCVVAWRYLPKIYFYTTILMWMGNYLKETKFYLPGMLKTLWKIKSIPNQIEKNKIDSEALSYLKSVQARLWY